MFHSIQFLSLVAIISTLTLWQNPVAKFIAGTVFLATSAHLISRFFFEKCEARLKYWLSFLTLTLFISASGAIIYFFFQLNNTGIIFIVLFLWLILFGAGWWKKRHCNPEPRIAKQRNSKIQQCAVLTRFFPRKAGVRMTVKSFVIILIFLILEGALFFTLVKYQIFDSVISPWNALPKWFFLLYFIAAAFLLLIIFFSRSKKIPLLCVLVHIAFHLSIPLLLYPLGYGFDPFIHQATEKVIFETGSIQPKPFYYLGQYALAVFASKIFSVPITWANKLLLPVFILLGIIPALLLAFLSSVTLVSGLRSPNNYFGGVGKEDQPTSLRIHRIPLLGLLFLLIFPIPTLTHTTPQALANLLIILLVTLYYCNKKEGTIIPTWFFFLIAFTALLIHPFAGIPALFFLLLACIHKKIEHRLHSFRLLSSAIMGIITIAGSIAIPAMLYMYGLLARNSTSTAQIAFQNNLSNLSLDFFQFLPSLPGKFHAFFDLIYLFKYNFAILLVLLILSGIFLLKQKKELHRFSPYLLAALISFVNGFLLRNFLALDGVVIEYEQSIFSNRLLQIGLYFLLPFIFTSMIFFLEKFETKIKMQRSVLLPAIFIFASLLSSGLYLSYPRADKYERDRSYNTSASDILAVQQIHQAARGEKYFVLSNQTVSAAALQEFSFEHFYSTVSAGPLYFYPIPTSSPLYQFYLEFVYEHPEKQTMQKAMQLMDTRLGFVVINSYWTDAKDIIESAKKDATDWWQVGEVYVFAYRDK